MQMMAEREHVLFDSWTICFSLLWGGKSKTLVLPHAIIVLLNHSLP